MKNSLSDAYKREMQLLPLVMEMEEKGIPISSNIHREYADWKTKYEIGEKYLEKISGGYKIGSRAMYGLFAEKGLIDPMLIQYTDKGNPKYGRDQIERIVTDDALKMVLLRRSKLQKVIGTYLKPWAESAVKNDFRFYPFFSQTRGDDDYGTRTGRFSSNLQQIPKEPEDNMPNLRKLIVAEKGHVLLQRDYSSQEVRVAAHFAEGDILQAFIENPDLDAHEWVSDMITKTTGQTLKRKIIKIVNFLKLYGGGVPALSSQAGMSQDNARDIFRMYDAAIPEFKQLAKDVERMVRGGTPLRTWGGRTYDVEPAKVIDGRRREFYYKLVNVLVQGSSADMSKEAMLRWYNHTDRHPQARIMLVVHDEIVLSCPEQYANEQMEILKWAMEDIPGWDVPIRSDGSMGHNFGELESVDTP